MAKLSDLYDQVEQKVDAKLTPAWAKPLRDNPRTAAIVIGVLFFVCVVLLWFVKKLFT